MAAPYLWFFCCICAGLAFIGAVNHTTWIIVGFFSGSMFIDIGQFCGSALSMLFFSVALVLGLTFIGVLVYICLGLENTGLPSFLHCVVKKN